VRRGCRQTIGRMDGDERRWRDGAREGKREREREREGERDRKREETGERNKDEREQVAGRRAYGLHPCLLTSAKSITCLGV